MLALIPVEVSPDFDKVWKSAFMIGEGSLDSLRNRSGNGYTGEEVRRCPKR